MHSLSSWLKAKKGDNHGKGYFTLSRDRDHQPRGCTNTCRSMLSLYARLTRRRPVPPGLVTPCQAIYHTPHDPVPATAAGKQSFVFRVSRGHNPLGWTLILRPCGKLMKLIIWFVRIHLRSDKLSVYQPSPYGQGWVKQRGQEATNQPVILLLPSYATAPASHPTRLYLQ